MNGLYVALVHYPVRAKSGEIITTAITNLDVHDIARSARTYGLAAYFIVTPIAAQRAIVERILAHWLDGPGTYRIPERGDALSLVAAVDSIDAAVARIKEKGNAPPRLIATSASAPSGAPVLTFAELRRDLREPNCPTLLLFGTGHGLAPEIVASADAVLEPIRGAGEYNHLSVRTAAGVAFDRLRGG